MEFIFSEQEWKDKDGKIVVTHIEVMEKDGHFHLDRKILYNEHTHLFP